MIARRLELLLLLFIVVHGKVVTHSGAIGRPQTEHDVPPVLHAVASCALGTASMKGAEKKIKKKLFVPLLFYRW